jgi:DNA-binding transcriptional regulator YdaS (Cro superfamily)
MTRDEVNELLYRMVKRAGSRSALAKEIGVSPAYIGDVLLGKRDPGPAILNVLGLRRQVQITYVQASKKK